MFIVIFIYFIIQVQVQLFDKFIIDEFVYIIYFRLIYIQEKNQHEHILQIDNNFCISIFDIVLIYGLIDIFLIKQTFTV